MFEEFECRYAAWGLHAISESCLHIHARSVDDSVLSSHHFGVSLIARIIVCLWRFGCSRKVSDTSYLVEKPGCSQKAKVCLFAFLGGFS